MLILRILWALAVLWHTMAFAAGGVNVWFAYRAMFGGPRSATSSRVIQSAEWQLWASGFAIVGLGIQLVGWDHYLANPKLWAKALLVTIWLASTLLIRYRAIPQLRQGRRQLMLRACSVSAACWIYGAFLGVAKTLANGALPFAALCTGFVMTIVGCLILTLHHEDAHGRAAAVD
ncbi:MAG: hypothetical protein KGN16_23065 [Burkholderiales bacterium]|nr:hypothetical protein [Burkholderiales bacterium]